MFGFAIVKIVETITNLFAEFVAIVNSKISIHISKASIIITILNFIYHQMIVIELNLTLINLFVIKNFEIIIQ